MEEGEVIEVVAAVASSSPPQTRTMKTMNTDVVNTDTTTTATSTSTTLPPPSPLPKPIKDATTTRTTTRTTTTTRRGRGGGYKPPLSVQLSCSQNQPTQWYERVRVYIKIFLVVLFSYLIMFIILQSTLLFLCYRIYKK